jgi:hypothetical protein
MLVPGAVPMPRLHAEGNMAKAHRLAAALVTALMLASSASACPVCGSETGRQVRAGIFNEQFGSKLVLTLLPFPVFLGVVAAIHFGFPFWMKKAMRQAPHSPLDHKESPDRITEAQP